jgi:hypothetical protein
MKADLLTPGQVVFHDTFGPGRILTASNSGIEVEFHDGRHEPFRPSYAAEALRLCGPEGFAARLLSGKESVLRALENDPRDVLSWLSIDLGRELTTRTAKPLLKRLHVFPDDLLEAAWARGSRKAQAQPPKRRIAEGEIKISAADEAKELEGKLWDADLHVDSRNAIAKALADFHEPCADEDFFLRVIFSPAITARARAFGFFRKRRMLGHVWDYLVRKHVDERSAPGMLDIWLRLVAESSSDEVRSYDARAAEILVALLGTKAVGGNRGDTLRRLFTTQTGSTFSFARAVASRIPPEWWDNLLSELSTEEKRRAFQLYFQAAINDTDTEEAVSGVLRFLSHFDPAAQLELTVGVASFAKSSTRYAFLRALLRESADLFASAPTSYPDGLDRLRSWLLDNRDALDSALESLFARLGYPVEARPVRLDRDGHMNRLQDATVPLAMRENSLEEVAGGLQRSELVAIIRRLADERGQMGEHLLTELWTRWQSQNRTSEAAALLLDVLGADDSGEPTHVWAAAKAQGGSIAEELTDLLVRRVRSRRPGEGLDPVARIALGRLHNGALGRRLRTSLLEELRHRPQPEETAFTQSIGDALRLLGVQDDVFDFVRDVAETNGRRIHELNEAVARLETTLQDVLSSEEVARETRRLVEESLRARETQLREDWDRSLEAARLGFAELYVDLATFVGGLRSRNDDDTSTIGGILIRRLEQLLASRLDLTTIGRPGEAVAFDSTIHEPSGEQPVAGDAVLVIRPGIQKRASGIVAKALVKKA